MLLTNKDFPHKHMVHTWVGLTRWTSHSHYQDIKTHSTHSWKIETIHDPISAKWVNIDLWGFNFSQSLCNTKFIGILSDENNQGLNYSSKKSYKVKVAIQSTKFNFSSFYTITQCLVRQEVQLLNENSNWWNEFYYYYFFFYFYLFWI
jgi:hypothetical protein